MPVFWRLVVAEATMTSPAPLVLTARRGRASLSMTCVALGRDLAVALGGGEAHIGAVAVSQPRPSHRPGGGTSATTSVIALPGHKEDDLARTLAARFASALGVVVTVACGIHLDDARPEELQDILDLAEALAGTALARLRAPSKG
jgi:hypothetical protein